MSSSIKRAKTSEIWNYFTPIPSENFIANCNICKRKLSFKTTNSNLKKHLTSNHPTIALPSSTKGHQNLQRHQEQEQQQQQDPQHSQQQALTDVSDSTESTQSSTSKTVQSKMTTFLPKRMNIGGTKNITEKLMLLFIKDFQPFSIVEDEGFKQFVHALNSGYDLPSRHSISKTLLPTMYEQCRNECLDMTKNVKSVCLTTDCWTSVNTESYIAVTAHFLNDEFQLRHILLDCSLMKTQHTSINLATEIKRVVTEWGFQEKVLLAVTDNASNIKNAITKELNWKHFGCFAHTINLIVKDALDNDIVSSLLKKVKTIVAHFKKVQTRQKS
ncbi:dna replication-related element factor isoform a [Holotrichia oblita]|uniref:Dna replication-related element factor isoform a n=1 Tax=Holotrichia oblita TaxID=644536 RepID=A0ACB9TMD6_HOLOL|nr:dna replication-related element factor isoform a [Holotrichia oblita]